MKRYRKYKISVLRPKLIAARKSLGQLRSALRRLDQDRRGAQFGFAIKKKNLQSMRKKMKAFTKVMKRLPRTGSFSEFRGMTSMLKRYARDIIKYEKNFTVSAKRYVRFGRRARR